MSTNCWNFNILLALLTLGYLLVTSCKSRKDECDKQPAVAHEPAWDFLLYVVQWPESFCLQQKEDNGEIECRVPAETHLWTIHGIWPSMTGGEGPESCNKSWTFDWSKIRDLEGELNELWPDLLSGRGLRPREFWTHEWESHGTCAANLPSLSGELNYFNASISMRRRFPVDEILSSYGIVPSSTARYSSDYILQALRTGLGSLPRIRCFTNTEFRQYLWEIELCLDKLLELFDCPPPWTTCNQSIRLPPITYR